MSSIDRRGWLTGVTALAVHAALAGSAQASQTMSAGPGLYDYLTLKLTVAQGGTPRQALNQYLRGTGCPAVQAAGGQILGVFTPQLGWEANQVAILIGWPGPTVGRDAAVAQILANPSVEAGDRDRLTPTVRPQTVQPPPAGGIFVHRWFVVQTSSAPEFVSLSVEGWRDFEGRFDTQIFGLFEAEPTPEEARQGLTRLLLVTRYRDHSVWEASRDPSTEAMNAFERRQRLTRKSWAASTLLAPV